MTPRITRKSSADPLHLVHDYNYAQVLTLDLLKEFTLEEVPIRYRGVSFVTGRYPLKVLSAIW